MRLIFGSCFFFLILYGCNDLPNCIRNSNDELTFDFKNFNTKNNRGAVPIREIFIIGSDSLFYQSDTLSKVTLPVNPGATETTFIFNLQAGRSDTLTVSYHVTPHYISDDCGFELLYDSALVVNHPFDSLGVISSIFYSSTQVNFELYF